MSFRSATKISSYLVRAKLYPLKRKFGSEKYGKSKGKVCLNIEKLTHLPAQKLQDKP